MGGGRLRGSQRCRQLVSVPRAPRRTGFTLIEALVTLAIAGLVAGIGFPGIQHSLDFWAFRSAALTTATALDAARARALLTGGKVQFLPAPDGNGFAVGDEPVYNYPIVSGSRAFRAPLYFFPDGSSSGGRLTIVGERGRRDFLVSPDTGLVCAR